MLTCFLATLGNGNILNWNTTFTDLKSIYALVFTLMKVFLLNMFIAVITAHYIEFYIEVGEEKSLFDLIIDVFKEQKPPHPDSEQYKKGKWWQKLQYRVAGWFHKILMKYVATEEKVEPTFDIEHLQKLDTDPFENVKLAEFLVERSHLPRYLNYKYTELMEKMKDVFFWAELIDSSLKRVRMKNKGIFFNSNKFPHELFLEFNSNFEAENHFYEDEVIQFCMLGDEGKIKTWNKTLKPFRKKKAMNAKDLLMKLNLNTNDLKLDRKQVDAIKTLYSYWIGVQNNDSDMQERPDSEESSSEVMEDEENEEKNNKAVRLIINHDEESSVEKSVDPSSVEESREQFLRTPRSKPSKSIRSGTLKSILVKNPRDNSSVPKSSRKNIGVSFKQSKLHSESDISSDKYSLPEQQQIDQEYRYKLRNIKQLSFTESLLKLWIGTKEPSVWIHFWFDKFNYQQRVALWNGLKFPLYYYKEL